MNNSSKRLRPLFLASFFFSIHLALLTYLNSTVLRYFESESMVSVIFTLGSALSLIFVFCAPGIVRRNGVIKTLLVTLLLSAVSLLIIGNGMTTTSVLIPVFILYFSLNSVIMYLFDILIEHFSPEKTTGNIRGAYLSINNIGWISGPLVAGFLSRSHTYTLVYMVAALAALICLTIIAFTERGFQDKQYAKQNTGVTFTLIRHSPALRRIMSINFILQFFYAWMVVYSPLYLMNGAHFGWATIGILFSIMLLPFALFEYPVGKLADKIGEKNIISVGIGIASIATLFFATAGTHGAIYYGIVLFCTRVGASTIEVSTDSYFFKHVKEGDTALISLYRSMLPIAYIIAPMAGALVLAFFSLSTLFVFLSLFLFVGIVYAVRLPSRSISTID